MALTRRQIQSYGADKEKSEQKKEKLQKLLGGYLKDPSLLSTAETEPVRVSAGGITKRNENGAIVTDARGVLEKKNEQAKTEEKKQNKNVVFPVIPLSAASKANMVNAGISEQTVKPETKNTVSISDTPVSLSLDAMNTTNKAAAGETFQNAQKAQEETVLPGVTRPFTQEEKLQEKRREGLREEKENLQKKISELEKQKRVIGSGRVGLVVETKEDREKAHDIAVQIDTATNRIREIDDILNTPRETNIHPLAYQVARVGVGAVETAENWASSLAYTLGDALTDGEFSNSQKKVSDYLAQNPALAEQLYIQTPSAAQRIADDAGVSVNDVEMFRKTTGAEYLREGLNSADNITAGMQTAGDMAETIGQMLPSILLTAGYTPANPAVPADGVGKFIASKVTSNVGTGLIASSVYGQQMEALGRERGFDPVNYLNAAANGAVEAMIEKYLGFSDFESFAKLFTPTGSTGKSILKSVANYIVSGSEEGLEEVINAPLSEIIDRMTGVSENTKMFGEGGIFDIAEMAKSGLDGAVVGLVMGGAGGLVAVAESVAESGNIRRGVQELSELQEILPESYRVEIPDAGKVTMEGFENLSAEYLENVARYKDDIASGKVDAPTEQQNTPTADANTPTETADTPTAETEQNVPISQDVVKTEPEVEESAAEPEDLDDEKIETFDEMTEDEDSPVSKAVRTAETDVYTAGNELLEAFDGDVRKAVDALYAEGNRLTKDGSAEAVARRNTIEAIRSDILSGNEKRIESHIGELKKVFKRYGVSNVVVDREIVESGANGYYNPSDRTVHISPALSSDKAVLFVAAHELTHGAAAHDTAIVRDIISVKDKLVSDGVFSAERFAEERYLRAYQQDAARHANSASGKAELKRYMDEGLSRADAVQRIVDDYIQQEMAADFIGELVQDPGILDTIKGKDRTLWQKIVDGLRELLDKIGLARDMNAGDRRLAETIRGILEDVSGEKADTSSTKDSGGRNAGTAEDTDVRFSMDLPVEESGELVAVHNLNESKLKKAAELGGFAMPSIAVVKSANGHDDFGEISAVFGKETIDPKANSKNFVYTRDAWTPLTPGVEYEANPDVEKKIHDLYYSLANKHGYDAVRDLYRYMTELDSVLNRNGGEAGMIEKLYDDTGMMQIYRLAIGKDRVEDVMSETVTRMDENDIRQNEFIIQEMGDEVISSVKTPEGEKIPVHRKKWMEANRDKLEAAYRKFLSNEYHFGTDEIENVISATTAADYWNMIRNAYKYMRDGAEKVTTSVDLSATRDAIRESVDEKQYRNWVKDLFGGSEKSVGIRNNKDPYTSSGNPRSFSALHYAYTLENVVKAMVEKGEKGISSMGSGNIFGASAKKMNSIEEIRRNKGKLENVTQEELETKKEEIYRRFTELANSLHDTHTDAAANMLVEAVAKYSTQNGIDKYLKRESEGWAKYTPAITEELISIVNDIQAMPVAYFEAKPQRAVMFDEVHAFIVPDNIGRDTRDVLDSIGRPVVEYTAGDKQSRLDALNSLEDIRFSRDVEESRWAESESFNSEISTWEKTGRDGDAVLEVGMTGDVLQGLGAIENDIYIRGDKISTIMEKHPEITLEEIRKIPQILNNPVLILKSSGKKTAGQNTRLVIFGSVKAKNGQPVLSILDLRPVEDKLVIDDMQKITSVYTKDSDPVEFIRNSDVLYAEKKVSTRLLRSVGFQMPTELLDSGYIGSISYDERSVKIEGKKFSEVFADGDIRNSRETRLKEENEYLKRQFVKRQGNEWARAVKPAERRKYAAQIAGTLQGVSAAAVDAQLAKVWKVFEQPVRGKLDTMEVRYDEAAQEAHSVAAELIADARVANLNPLYEQYAELRKRLREVAIRPGNAKTEIPDYAEWRKSSAGVLRLSDSGIAVDSVWDELCGLWPEFFDISVTDETQRIETLADVANKLRAVPGNPNYNIDGVSAEDADNIIAEMEYSLANAILAGYDAVAKETEAAKLEKERLRSESASAKTHAESFRNVEKAQTILENERVRNENAAKLAQAEAEGAILRYTNEVQGVLAIAEDAVTKAKNFEKQVWADFAREHKALEVSWRKANRAVEAAQEKVIWAKKKVAAAQEKTNRAVEMSRERVIREKKKAEAARQRQELAAVRKNFMGNLTRVYNTLVDPTKNKHVPEELRESVAGLLENFAGTRLPSGKTVDFRVLSDIKEDAYANAEKEALGKLERINGIIARNHHSEDGGVTKKFIDDFSKQVQLLGGMFAEINMKSADDARMKPDAAVTKNMEYLKQCNRILDMVNKYIRDMNVNFLAGKAVDARIMAGSVIDTLSKRKPESADTFLSNVQYDFMTPETFFERLGTVGTDIIKAYRRAQNRQASFEQSYTDYMKKLTGGKYSTYDVGHYGKLVEIAGNDGKILKVPKDQIMELYVLWNRPAARRHLRKGGAIFLDEKGREIDTRTMVFDGNMESVFSVLTDDDKRICGGIVRYLSTRCAEQGNEASMYLYGYRKFGDKNYFPMHVSNAHLPGDWDQMDDFSRLENMGFTKKIAGDAAAPLRIGGLFDTADSHVRSMAAYASYAPVNSDVTRLIDMAGVKGNIEQHLGKRGYAYLTDFIKAVEQNKVRAGDNITISKGFDKLANAYKRAAVSWNISTAMKQPISIVRALNSIDGKYIAQAYGELTNPKNASSAAERMVESSGVAKMKVLGYSDVGFGKSLRQNYDESYSPMGDKQKNAVTRNIAKAYENFTDAGMWLAGKMDEVTWTRIWRACELEVSDKHRGLTFAEQNKKVTERFNEVIGQTQVVDTILDNAPILRNEKAMLYTAFMSEPIKSLNSLIAAGDAVAEHKPGAKQKMAKAAATLAVSNILLEPIVSIAFSMLRDDEDEEDFETTAKKALNLWIGIPAKEDDDFFTGIISSQVFDNVFSFVPYLKDIVSVVTNEILGYDNDRIDMANYAKAVNSVKNLIQSYYGSEKQKTKANLWVTAVEDLLAIGGIPAKTLRRDLTAVYRTFIQATDNYNLQWELNKALYNINSSSARTQKGFFDIMAKAAQAGDTEAYERMSKDFEDIITSSSVGIKRSDILEQLEKRGYEIEVGSDLWYIDLQAGFDLDSFNPGMKAERMITEVYRKTEDDSILPKSPSNNFTVAGESIKIDDPIQYQAFAEEVGDYSYMVLVNMASLESYKNLTDEQKASAIAKAYDYARRRSRKNLYGEYDMGSNVFKGLYEEKANPSDAAKAIVKDIRETK